MKYELSVELLQIVLQILGNAKSTGLSCLETTSIINQLRELPKIEDKPADKKVDAKPIDEEVKK